MDLKQLLYFVTIAKEGTISAAAKKLYLSQPPLSHQMHLLEKELQCTLFERGARNIKLTDEGEILYKKAEKLLKMSDNLKEEIISLSNPYKGTIRIGMVSSIVSTYGVRWITAFSKMYPHIMFEINEANTYHLIEKLNDNSIHMAILRSPYIANDFSAITIDQERMVAIGHKDFWTTGCHNINLQELSQLPLTTYRRWQKIITRQFEEQSLPCRYTCICDDARTTAALVSNKIGVGIVPESTYQLIHDNNIRCLPITDFSIRSNIELVYSPDAYIPTCSKLFIDYIKNLQPTEIETRDFL